MKAAMIPKCVMLRLRQPAAALWAGAAAAVVALLAASGCGAGSSAYDRYVPSEPVARLALSEALEQWKRGEPPGRLQLESPLASVEVSDSRRRPGQKLIDYQILGEIAAEGPRSFSVKLHLDYPRQEKVVRYYVLGIDPLWVFNQKDYELIMHWEGCEEDEEESENPANEPLARNR
jgi:hypothetical protein